ncbi:GNAT family N-acetyltransferase [Variovorax sp. CCNWLW235]|uniref:GNAT family N-acetyltransferase n=1 Tax=Variovorax sp. CCNWLW235 TaxID=3127463 RepID=UPI0030772D37
MAPRIVDLQTRDFSAFAEYLNDHISDNGTEGEPLFQPIARIDCHFAGEKATGFRRALDVAPPNPGWRRAWVALSGEDRIVGHVDLRAHPAACMEHRCLLGMGVHREWRRSGLGQRLLDAAVEWAKADQQMAWIDLQVIASNDAAVRLYERAGFTGTGLVQDCFRVDGRQVDYLSMALPVQAR